MLAARRLTGVTTAAVALALVATPPASATLAARLTRALTVPGVSWSRTAAIVVDLASGRRLYGRNPGRSLKPASNEKLTVALAALDELGPAFRIPTDVLGEGRLDGHVWRGTLVLKGYGDPTLSRRDLLRLADAIRRGGIRRLTRPVEGDESYFDRRRTAPGWKPSFYKIECPPLSALVVDRARVGGRTVEDPALSAARAFSRALRSVGVRVPRGARKGTAAEDAVRLARVSSPRLERLLVRMNRKSDNFLAETLLKELGAREAGRGTTAAGARVVVSALRARSLPLRGVRIVDGSGLSRYDRLTARSIAALLVSAWRDRRVRWRLFLSLPLAGVEGTLADRLERPPARRHVRAKTGTTSSASALSGYVRRRLVFSVLQNASPIPWWWARYGQDRFVQILAGL